jgi:ubiquinone/menaquinone biosynthesis C-methylase UbiE
MYGLGMGADYDIPREIIQHYEEDYDEAERLFSGGWGQVELLRTKELIRRFAPSPPAKIVDVGGGPGVYAAWLTDIGYEVHLIDPITKHVEQAGDRAEDIAVARVGDARSLDYPQDTFDMALLLGPLYHLIERADRLQALREARRVTKTGKPVVVAAINRFASAIDNLHSGTIDDPEFRKIAERDITDGIHLNTTEDPRYFTTAFFHRADELERELTDAGLTGVEVFAVEGIAWAASDLDERTAAPEKRKHLLDLIRRLEREETLLGATGHLLAVGWATAD